MLLIYQVLHREITVVHEESYAELFAEMGDWVEDDESIDAAAEEPVATNTVPISLFFFARNAVSSYYSICSKKDLLTFSKFRCISSSAHHKVYYFQIGDKNLHKNSNMCDIKLLYQDESGDLNLVIDDVIFSRKL